MHNLLVSFIQALGTLQENRKVDPGHGNLKRFDFSRFFSRCCVDSKSKESNKTLKAKEYLNKNSENSDLAAKISSRSSIIRKVPFPLYWKLPMTLPLG